MQLIAAIIVSCATPLIGWQTYRLNDLMQTSNVQLQQISQELAKEKFNFDQIKDIYDRAERYLNSAEQDEKKGKALVVLINSLPNKVFRENLLSIVVSESSSPVVASQAADAKVHGNVEDRAFQVYPKPEGFTGNPLIVINPDGYTVTVQQGYGFKDSKGIEWSVPAGFKSDGASIPRAYWSIVGSPLGGSYTLASVIHDYHIRQKTSTNIEVNKMFYEAMIKSGVSESKAWIFYQAINTFGPRWDKQSNISTPN